MNRSDIWMLMEAQKATLDDIDEPEFKSKRLISYLAAIAVGVIMIALLRLG